MNNNPDTDPLLTSKEVAEYLKLTTPYVRILARRGIIPNVRIGRQLRFQKKKIDQWLEENNQRKKGEEPCQPK